MFKRYVWRTILPYFLLSWLILTVILFLQQGSRFSEILFTVNVPGKLLFELSLALIISVVAFTGPMGLLAGIVIGLGQMRGDSELTALQAAGIGKRTILWPCLLAGLIVSGIALVINLAGVPIAASIVRRVAVEAALIKLESPIEPGVFNTEFSNYVIYVRDGNNEQGIWERVFIYLPQKDGQIQLITARSGRIDAADEKSELVLSDAVVTTLPSSAKPAPVTLDKVNQLRVSLDTGRQQLRQKLEGVERSPEEMGLFELAAFARQKSGNQRIEAEILWHRRLALSLAPFFLSLLGAAVSWQFGRGGRGWAAAVSLAILVFYYLLSLLGEQAARAGILPALAGGWLATLVIFLTATYTLWRSNRTNRIVQNKFGKLSFEWLKLNRKNSENNRCAQVKQKNFALKKYELSFFGLLERDFLQNLWWYFIFSSLALLLLFHVFTIFEVLRGVTANSNGVYLLVKYLLLLSPSVVCQIAPTALMIAILVTYTLKARQNETTIWGAAGQSLYVLILPAILSAAVIGVIDWELQEKVLPSTNPRQDILRSQLRGGAGSIGHQQGRAWVATADGIYSFNYQKGSDNVAARNVEFYQFSTDRESLKNVIRAESANWQNSAINFGGQISQVKWEPNFVKTEAVVDQSKINWPTVENPFNQVQVKTVYLSSTDLEKAIQTSESTIEARRLRVALQKKYTTIFLPLVIVFFSTPLALWRRGRQGSLSFSVGLVVFIWLLFTMLSAICENLGSAGILPPVIAVWSPLIAFSSIGWYLLAKARN